MYLKFGFMFTYMLSLTEILQIYKNWDLELYKLLPRPIQG